MKRLLILMMFTSFGIQAQEKTSPLTLLSNYMTGSFNSSLQAEKDTNYFNICLDMKRIWEHKTDGVWLYVEQALNKTDAKPYRQRVYHLQQIGKKRFSSTIYKIDSAEKYIGYHLDQSVELTPENIELLEGCALLLNYNGKVFKGETERGKCLNSWGEATYATSEVIIQETEMVSWDRGWNDKDEYVWGAEKAGYRFVKQKKAE